jgi:hypothetical protein
MAVKDQPLGPPPVASASIVTVTGWRDPERSRWIPTLSTAWSDPASLTRQVVALPAPAGVPKLGEVLRDLLFALGKSPYVTGGSKIGDGGLDVPAAWLMARATREIIILDAPELPKSVLRSLIELATGVGARIWLIGHVNRAGDLDEIAVDWEADEWTLEQFDKAWDRPAHRLDRYERRPSVSRRTDLPSTSALTFRADCRSTLREDRFRQVDAVYRRELLAARDEFDSRAADGRLAHDTIATLLRRRVRETATTDDVVATVRAIEAAALPYGFSVDVDLPALINAAERNPRPGRYTVDDEVALDAYIRPSSSAACALAMADVPPTEIIDLTVGAVADDGAAVTTEDGVTHIDAWLRPYLRAQLLVRRFAAAASDEPFLITDLGSRVTASWVARTVKLAEVECVVRLARPRYDRERLTVYDWLTAHGIGVRVIPGASQRSLRS